MSLSYTGEATMDEPALRDVERWKDKIEVRLDNRQVFFLFFGSALCACMLFVLGVIVGKRLESRGRAAVPEVQDPLAVLDRINSVGPGGSAASVRVEPALTFPKALIGAPAHGRALATAPATASAAAPPSAPGVAKVSTLASKAAPVVAAKATAPAAPKPPITAAPKPPVAAAPKPVAVAASKTPPAVAGAPVNKGKLALQLSSFPDRGEAEAFAKRFAAQGAYVVVSEIPGKGTWYRVRVGSFSSSQEAIAAKGAFEKQTNVIAYIAGR
jgi:DedD protein